jgi:general secretion pathway protein H
MNRCVPARTAGFTLIEMLVVMGLLSLIFAVVIAARPKTLQLHLQSEARSVMAELMSARTQAIATNQETVVWIDTEKRRITLSRFVHDLPRGMTVAMTIANTERSGQGGGLRFFPDGQSSGGEIALALDGRASRISVNWLTGQPRLLR